MLDKILENFKAVALRAELRPLQSLELLDPSRLLLTHKLLRRPRLAEILDNLQRQALLHLKNPNKIARIIPTRPTIYPPSNGVIIVLNYKNITNHTQHRIGKM